MDAFIARQPIIDKFEKIIAYEILYYQDSGAIHNQRDYRVANATSQFFTQIGSSRFLEGKDAFLTFTPNLLMQNIPRIFAEDKLVIQIEDDALAHPVAQMIIQRYDKQGYRLALVGFELTNRHFNILSSISILKVDFSDPGKETILTGIDAAKRFNKQIAAYNVNSPAAKQKALELGCDYMQGDSIVEVCLSDTQPIGYTDSNSFRLLEAAIKDEPDMAEIAAIIGTEETLAHALLKIVNSAYFAPADTVRDIRQALLILGLDQLKQWIYLLCFEADDGIRDEMLKISFRRANFCRELGGMIHGFPLNRMDSYLMGMLSALGSLVNVRQEDALNQLHVSARIKDGLAGKDGAPGDLFNLMVSYERGEWIRMYRFAGLLGIPATVVAQKYFEEVEYVNDMWNEMMRPFSGDGYS